MLKRWWLLAAVLVLAALANGCTRACAKCAATGRVTVEHSCDRCTGTGTVRVPCKTCGGKGNLQANGSCPYCQGTGTVKCRYTLYVEDPQGCPTYIQGKMVRPKLPVVCKNGRLEGADWKAEELFVKGETAFRNRVCPNCHGQGTVACSACRGMGRFESAGPCPTCGGSGETMERCPACEDGRVKSVEPCPACGGKGRVGVLSS